MTTQQHMPQATRTHKQEIKGNNKLQYLSLAQS